MTTSTFFKREFDRRNRWLLFGAGFALTLLLGVMDQVSGNQSSFSLLYLIPVALAAWFMEEVSGVITAAVCTITWMVAASGAVAQSQLLVDVIVRFAFFLIVALLLTRLSRTLRAERQLARTDHVTGAVNARFFTELTQMEIRRFSRYRRVFTVAYIDLDNFKSVNDRFGHNTGDLVLQRVTQTLRRCLRDTDVVARLGGDEFAVLMPETDEAAARSVLTQIKANLLAEMGHHRWPVTFSIGVVSFHTVPQTVSDLIKTADELMYTIKAAGKNEIRYAVYAR